MHERSHALPEFKADDLKVLDDQTLAKCLIDDAFAVLAPLNPAERLLAEDLLTDIVWVPTDTEAETAEALRESYKNFAGRLASRQLSAGGQYLDPDEALQELGRKQVNIARESIARHKESLDFMLNHKPDYDWTEKNTAAILHQICDFQILLGTEYDTDYVRKTAINHISTPAIKGIILLDNAVVGDEISSLYAITDIKQAIAESSFDETSMLFVLELLEKRMTKATGGELKALRTLSIDVLGKLRELIGEASLTKDIYTYAAAAADLGVFFRDGSIARGEN